jgi:sugar phosphate isomerase/epimerase
MLKYKRSALIGYSGFVGFNMTMKYDYSHEYNSTNIEDMRGLSFDCVTCAGISAVKWWANANPEEDYKNVMKLLDVLSTITAKKFILISTIDVYNNVNNPDANEDTEIDPENNHPYGKHRYMAETFVKDTFVDYLIVRMPGVIGFALKKNMIYDYVNGKLLKLNPNSAFQWYNVTNLPSDLHNFMEAGLRVVNVFSEPVQNKELTGIFERYPEKNIYKETDENFVQYNIGSKYGNKDSKYFSTKENAILQIERYIDNMLDGRLLISNLAWRHNHNEIMLRIFSMFGITSLEVSPYKYFNYGNDEIDIYAFQAILYPQTCNIFTEPDEVYNHLCDVLEKANTVGAKVAVFGCPKNRRKGELSYSKAMTLAVKFFKRIAPICQKYNVVMAIEPTPKCYMCDFINNSSEGRELVLKVNHPNFRLHLDVGCMYLEGEDSLQCITKNLDILEHIHLSAPELQCLLTNNNVNYKELYYAIKKIYTKKISIEMLGQDDFMILRDIVNLTG